MKKLVNILLYLLICLSVVVIYTIIHEGSYAAFAVIFGGRIPCFDINFISSYPHVSYSGDFTLWNRALISLASPVVSYIFMLIFIMMINKNSHIIIKKMALLSGFFVLGSVFANIALPIAFKAG